MKRTAILLAATAFASVLPALAAQPAPKEPEATANGRIVCFAEPVTGSHMRKRVCMTEEERERRRAEDQEAMKKFKSGSGGRGAAGSDAALPSPGR